MLTRFDPFRDVEWFTRGVANSRRPSWVAMDAYRQGDQVIVNLDLPGVDPSSVDITVEKDTLTIKAERHFGVAEGDRVLVSERPQGSFSRRLLLGEALDGERTEARFDNGVLTLTVPVAEQAKPRKVAITSGAGPETTDQESAAA
ncbi:MAG TPA: Hsp20/alpha crystallin family protein [Acidimicrobiales bacterium]|nr:Hsp20/alpha crystallin family protein [Acidimicrobiales bacterium]